MPSVLARTCIRFSRCAGVLLLCFQLQPIYLRAQSAPVSIQPGTPNVWSLEQAHYILSRLRANEDGLQNHRPSEQDLDPNALNASRLDVLQRLITMGVGFDQILGTQNSLSLRQFQEALNRRDTLLKQEDDKRAQMEDLQLRKVVLDRDIAELQDRLTVGGAPSDVAQLTKEMKKKKAESDALHDQASVLQSQIKDLDTTASAAGPSSSSPSLTGSAGAIDTSTHLNPAVTGDVANKIMAASASSFGQPRLHASTILDNFIQMQYEIVAKQLTTLRDEVGRGQRIVFLELPVSISAANERKNPFARGGENRLAQAWWQIEQVYLAYDKDTSPCWGGVGDVFESNESEVEATRGHDVDEVPKLLKGGAIPKDQNKTTTDQVELKTSLFIPLDKHYWETLNNMEAAKREVEEALQKSGTPTPELKALRSRFGDAQSAFNKAKQARDAALTDFLTAVSVGWSDYFGSGVRNEIRRLEKPCLDARNRYTTRLRDDDIQQSLISKQATVFAYDLKRSTIQKDLNDLMDKISQPTSRPRQRNAKQASITANENAGLSAQIQKLNSKLDSVAQQLSQEESETFVNEKHIQEDKRQAAEELQQALQLQQLKIYLRFGGPSGIDSAFRMDVCNRPSKNAPSCTSDGNLLDSGMVRTVEIIPRQSALNVNSTHAAVNHVGLTGMFQLISGIGMKGNYEQMREHYDQFLQQEVFASGFGKGESTFGWTFGPNPGTHVLNPGVRTTYAALTVPSNATGVVVRSTGCSFHHNHFPPDVFPDDNEVCENISAPEEFSLGLPDRDSSGSFFIRRVNYSPVNPGERATVVLTGDFSPEINVLVNGKRLNELVGLGKPLQTIDDGSPETDGSGVIYGSFEYVNDHQLALALNVPPSFKSYEFPQITLIAPSRSAIINSFAMGINDHFGKLDDESLVRRDQTFSLIGLSLLDTSHASLSGTGLSQLNKLWINGRPLPTHSATPISETNALLSDLSGLSDDLTWTITGVTRSSFAKLGISSSITVNNPLRLSVTNTSVQAGSASYDTKGKANAATFVVTGTALRPEYTYSAIGGAVDNVTYISPTQTLCHVSKVTGAVTISVKASSPSNQSASGVPVSISDKSDSASDKPDKPDSTTKTTVTEIKKTVTSPK